jgi:hypothetical protein
MLVVMVYTREDESMIQSYREKIDQAVDWHELKEVLDELSVELDQALASPYMEEESYRQQVHDIEIILRYGENKLEKMLS